MSTSDDVYVQDDTDFNLPPDGPKMRKGSLHFGHNPFNKWFATESTDCKRTSLKRE